MDGGASGAALLARRRPASPSALTVLLARRQAAIAVAEAQHPLHVEAVRAFLVGGDRGVGEGAAGDDRRPALDQRRRALAERRRLGGGVAARRGQLGGALGRGEVDPDRDLRRLEGRVEPRARLGRRRSAIVGVALARRPRSASTRRSTTGVPGFVSRPGSRLDDAAEDQPLARPGRGDVEEAQLLLGVALLRLLAELARSRRG